MVTFSPMVSGQPASACSTDRSCTLLLRPMLKVSVSPRSTAPNQTLAFSASTTLPMTWALSATQAPAPICGCTPSSS